MSLSSLHVDEDPGDRASDCGGIMEPVAVWVRKGGDGRMWYAVAKNEKAAVSENRSATQRLFCNLWG